MNEDAVTCRAKELFATGRYSVEEAVKKAREEILAPQNPLEDLLNIIGKESNEY